MTADFGSMVASGQVWVLDKHPVEGFIVMYPKENALQIENVAVDPIQHGYGFGAQLLQFAEDEAIRMGLGQITLYTNIHMTENLSFYPSLGFRETGRRREDGFDRVYFAKSLDAAGLSRAKDAS